MFGFWILKKSQSFFFQSRETKQRQNLFITVNWATGSPAFENILRVQLQPQAQTVPLQGKTCWETRFNSTVPFKGKQHFLLFSRKYTKCTAQRDVENSRISHYFKKWMRTLCSLTQVYSLIAKSRHNSDCIFYCTSAVGAQVQPNWINDRCWVELAAFGWLEGAQDSYLAQCHNSVSSAESCAYCIY